MPDPTSRPLVSIITPAYNTGRYLQEAVDSALAQTFTDFELLIVDDGSTDDTLAVARRLAAHDPRIRVISTPNGGAAAARNAALTLVRGSLVALLDSDDSWAPDYLSAQIAVLHERPDAAIVSANATNRGGPHDGTPFWPITAGVRTLTLRDLIDQEDAVSIMAVMRREVIDRIGGFDARFTGNEDYHFWLRAANAGFVVVQNRTPLAWYRRRPDSTSANERRMLLGILKVLREAAMMSGALTHEQETLSRQLTRFQTRLARVEVRDSLVRRDAIQAARSLRLLSNLRGGWLLSTAATLSAAWPQPLLWAYQARTALLGDRGVVKGSR